MHTDEYEISIAREINHCERVVKQLKAALAARQGRFGFGYPEIVEAEAAGRVVIGGGELAAWREDFEALPDWEQRLAEYREALATMRITASRF
jgi:hypothetical protein